MASGLASLRDANGFGTLIRWYRRVAPQPPANRSEPSGFVTAYPGENHLIVCANGHPGGMPAISRGLREARAPPPERSRNRLDLARGRSHAQVAFPRDEGLSVPGGEHEVVIQA